MSQNTSKESLENEGGNGQPRRESPYPKDHKSPLMEAIKEQLKKTKEANKL